LIHVIAAPPPPVYPEYDLFPPEAQAMADSKTAKKGDSLYREAVAVFDTAESLELAIEALESNGFDRADISLLADAKTVEEKLGHRYKKVDDLEDDPNVPRTAFVSTASIGDAEGALVGALSYVGAVAAAGAMVATGGTLAAAIAAAMMSGTASGLVGTALASVIDFRHAEYLQDQLAHGGLLLWVRTPDAVHELRAIEILQAYSAHDVHVHTVPTPSM
jgi:hypothetical protein